ncbi:hypothetical protein F4805DRAFT_472325 [Annulohypoxylon moriforme]|nr:hypothetical protein F4805DRAFT_472325 [Annulohypoxylon moriforme]
MADPLSMIGVSANVISTQRQVFTSSVRGISEHTTSDIRLGKVVDSLDDLVGPRQFFLNIPSLLHPANDTIEIPGPDNYKIYKNDFGGDRMAATITAVSGVRRTRMTKLFDSEFASKMFNNMPNPEDFQSHRRDILIEGRQLYLLVGFDFLVDTTISVEFEGKTVFTESSIPTTNEDGTSTPGANAIDHNVVISVLYRPIRFTKPRGPGGVVIGHEMSFSLIDRIEEPDIFLASR